MAAWLLSLLLIGGPLAAGEGVPPPDACASEPTFVAFRDALRSAIAHKDADHVLAVAADDIQISFGDIRGREDFARMWELDRPQSSRLWHELSEVLRLGCGLSGDGHFMSPMLGEGMTPDDDPFEVVIAVQPDAVLRSAPDEASDVVARLSWDVLTVGSDGGSEDWIPVTMRDGRRGFVHRRHVRSLLDYRATFAKIDGRWRMTAFIAGD
jgi:hypothetical protein